MNATLAADCERSYRYVQPKIMTFVPNGYIIYIHRAQQCEAELHTISIMIRIIEPRTGTLQDVA